MSSAADTGVMPPSAGSTAHAVFRCDASPEIGNGHLRRCLTLARALAACGWRTTLAMGRTGFAALPDAAFAGIGRISLDDRDGDDGLGGADRIANAIGEGGAKLLVVDHYRLDRRFEAACRAFAKRIAVIDDLADRRHDTDLLLDQTFGRAAGDYAPLVPSGCRLLCGSQYALLRPVFARRRPAALARRRVGGPVRRILVAMGAADADNATSLALDALVAAEGRPGTWAIDVVLGAVAPHLNDVKSRVEAHPSARLHVDVRGAAVATLMDAADLAIGAGGTTSWERCCLGLPSVVIVTADNQATITANLAAAGACHAAGDGKAIDANGIAAAIATLTGDADLRLRMSEAAAAVCDGDGAARTVAAIEELMTDRARSSGPARP